MTAMTDPISRAVELLNNYSREHPYGMNAPEARAIAAALAALVSDEAGVEEPEDVTEWMEHMTLHVTEHDLRHAGLALRAAWPTVRGYIDALRSRLVAERARAQEAIHMAGSEITARDGGKK